MTPSGTTFQVRPSVGLSRRAKAAYWLAAALLVVVLIAVVWFIAWIVGNSPDRLETEYGRHRSVGQSGSVNGTDVLAALFEEAGHVVHFRRTLVTDEMVDADVVVWFPNDPAAPTEEVIQWFDDWLAEYPGRTLVYVGRDYSAAPAYFKFLMEHLAKEKKAAPGAKQADAKKVPVKRQPILPDLETVQVDEKKAGLRSEWFHYEEKPHKQVMTLSGPWARGVDAAKSSIELNTRMVPETGVERLLTSHRDLLVGRLSRRYWSDSQVILVTNGSFLLNMPLVNHENRKLAGKLIEAVGEPVEVVFLESGPGGPPIDPPYADNSLWTLFEAWPLGAILLQLAAVGVIFCFARWPIFGRPKQPPPESTADFAKHVAAVGQLLARTKELPPGTNPGLAGDHSRAPSSPPLEASTITTTSEIPPEVRANLARRPPALPPDPRGN